MTDTTGRSDTPYRAAIGVVAAIGLYQGAVPLVARGLFDADQRFVPTRWLAAPWWWIACVAIVAVTLVCLAAIDRARERRFPDDQLQEGDGQPGERDAATPAPASPRGSVYDALAGLVFLVGLYNGPGPFIARLVFDDGLLLALPLRLNGPWWWITSLVVTALTAALLVLIDYAKQRSAVPRDLPAEQ